MKFLIKKYNSILILTLFAFGVNAAGIHTNNLNFEANSMTTNTIYDVVTLTFEAQQQYTNYSDVKMKAVFKGPNGEIITNAAFWNGDNQWAVRLFPTSTGSWNYITSSTPADAGLNNQTGSFEVVSVQTENPLRQHGGVLKVSANKRYLTYTDGTPFFWLGDTWWFCPSSLMPFDTCYKKCIDTRAAQDYSIVQMTFLGSINGRDPRTLIKQGKIDPEYWQEVDRYINYANDNGIVVVFGLTFHSGMDSLTLSEWEKLWDYAIARYGAHAVTFLICGEYNQNNVPDRVSKVLSLGQYIKNTDPYKRAMSVHAWWYKGEKHQAWNENWYDFVMLQGAHESSVPPHTLYSDIYFGSLDKPVLESECRYEGIHDFDAADVRKAAYRAIQAGSFGYTYGSHGLWYATQGTNDNTFSEWGTPMVWSNALIRLGGAQMKHLKSLYESLEWWKLVPKLNAIDSNITLGDSQDVLVKADGDNLFVIYFPNTTVNFNASLTGMANGEKYTAKWFNPRTGAEQNLQNDLYVNNQKILLPVRPSQDDWLIILNKKKSVKSKHKFSPKSFNVKDYGAKGNGKADDTAAILAAISTANASTSFAEVYFPAGNYRISSTKKYALQLKNLSDIRLRGEGTNTVLLVSNPGNGCIGFTDSTNVAVEELTVDYDPLPFTQGTITVVDTARGTFDLLIDPGYLELSHPAFSIAESRWGITVDLAREAYGLWAYFSSAWTNIDGRKWRMTADDPSFLQAHPLSVGDRYAHMARRYTCFDIGCISCTGVELKDITVYAAAGLTVGMMHSEDIIINGLNVGLKPGSTRLLSTNGDCVHAAGCKDGLLIENCYFEGMPDDGINIHGRGGVIISNVTETIKHVGTPRPTLFVAGDEIQILNNAAGGIRGNAIILEAVQVNDVVWKITLNRSMPNLNASWHTGDKLSNISRCGQGSMIRNNFFGLHRGRGVLLQSHDITVSNNHFYNPSLWGNAVSLFNGYWYYAEGPASYNVGIYGNTFESGTNHWPWTTPSVSIHSSLSEGIQSPSYDSSNVVIEGNTFINVDGSAVEATSVSGVRMTDNTVNTVPGSKGASTPVVMLGNAEDIQINGMVIHDLNPATYAGVHIKNTVSYATDSVVISNLTAKLATGSVKIKDDRLKSGKLF